MDARRLSVQPTSDLIESVSETASPEHDQPEQGPPAAGRRWSRTRRAAFALSALRAAIDEPKTELRYRDEYELLLAVILSAQCTDARVNKVTPALFEAFPNVEALADASQEDVFPYVQSVTYPNNKAGYLARLGRMVVDDFDGALPRTLDGLQALPGVGRKTAQVVASVAYEIAALPVDTHVFRVSNRLGLTKKGADTPRKVERQIKRVIPKEDWGEAHHLLILHGRYTCTARSPSCNTCPLTPACRYYARRERLPAPLDGLEARKGAYFCNTCSRYFDAPAAHTDRHDQEQTACPACGSMQVFDSKSGETTKAVLDYRV
jgi:endonuclease-3